MVSWTTKARIQSVLSWLPGGHHANWVLQRHVTRGYPRRGRKLDDLIDAAIRHVEAVEAATGRPRDELRFLEFGAGWDLVGPLTMAGVGVRSQLLLDIRPLARRWLVLDVADQLRQRGLDPGLGAGGDIRAVLAPAGIEYRAPGDASETGLPEGSIDVVTSTNTLEHIAADHIAAILAELRRVLAPGGVCSFAVDYHDHYADVDRSIGDLNFLRYSDREWARWNSSLHFQNRLRHADYVSLFEQAGFEVRVDEVRRSDLPDDLELDERWLDRALDDVLATYGWFVLRPLAPAAPGHA